MTKEQAIKVLNMVEAHGLADEAKRMAIKALEQEPRWIPVSEKLPPEEYGEYLVTTKYIGSYSGNVYIETIIAVYRKNQNKWDWDCANDVIAWMPLPEPFKAESEDKE